MNSERAEGYDSPMVQYLVWAMQGRGEMSNQAIYAAVKEQCRRFNRPLADHWEDQIRETLQAYCPTCPEYEKRGRPGDYFIHHKRGYWSCKITSPAIQDL